MLLLLFGGTLPLKENSKYLYSDQKVFPKKRSIERIVMTVDFANQLADGETITEAEWHVEAAGNPGVDIYGMDYGLAVVNGTKVMQLITGGEPGSSYEPYCLASTSGFQKLTLPEPGMGVLRVV